MEDERILVQHHYDQIYFLWLCNSWVLSDSVANYEKRPYFALFNLRKKTNLEFGHCDALEECFFDVNFSFKT